MDYHAIAELDEALEAVEGLFWPVEWDRWWRFALVALFVGGGAVVSVPVQFTPEFSGRPGTPEQRTVLLVLAALFVLALVVALAFAVVGAVMELVFVEALRERHIEVRRFFRRRLGQGLRLFLFRLGLALATALVVVLLFALAFVPVLADLVLATVLTMLLAVVLAMLVGLAAALVQFFTTYFVVPTMVLTGAGPLDAWRRVWAAGRGNADELAIYVLLAVALAFARGTVVGTLVGFGGIVLLVPFGIAGLAAAALVDVSVLLGGALLLVVGLLYGLAMLALAGVVKAPVVAYLRYHAMLVLGDLDPDLDPIPELRAELDDGDG